MTFSDKASVYFTHWKGSGKQTPLTFYKLTYTLERQYALEPFERMRCDLMKSTVSISTFLLVLKSIIDFDED